MRDVELPTAEATSSSRILKVNYILYRCLKGVGTVMLEARSSPGDDKGVELMRC